MHVLAETPTSTLDRMVQVRPRERPGDKLRAAVLSLAARFLNYRRFSGDWRVDLPKLEAGEVDVVLSVLYEPFDELDLDEPYGAAPERGYYADLIRHLERVEAELDSLDPQGTRHLVVTREAQLAEARDSGRIAFVHCVEGGFHLGTTPEEVDAHVTELAGRGIAYITLAHLFWRRVAANAPALPFLPDPIYNFVFPQRGDPGLSELGRAAVKAMYRERVLVDISHMREDAVDETFALLEALDAEHGADPSDHPVIASHVGYRFGSQKYNLSERNVRRVAARGGLIGLIFAQHQINDGVRRRETKRLDQSMAVLSRHIDEIHRITGSFDQLAIGSDLDGFIKPTIGGVESAADFKRFADALRVRYPEAAERMLSDNVIRVLGPALRR